MKHDDNKINRNDSSYRRTNTTVSLINYHFIFCPRYRRRVLVGVVETRLRQLLCESCEKLNCQILAVEIMPDHVHLFVSALPQSSPAEIMNRIKGYTSYRLRAEFEHLHRQKSLWTRSYFVGTAGSVSTETIKRYVENQKKQS